MKNASNPSPGNILLVDDTPENLSVLSELLIMEGYTVRCAISGQVALQTITISKPDLILLDISMPEMNGFEVCTELQHNPDTCEIPVIFISAHGETTDKVTAFETGGVDYITKPFQIQEVLARITTHITLAKTKAALQQLNTHLEERVTERTAELHAEVAERQRVQEQLLHWAMHDPLTELPNRAQFMHQVETTIQQTKTTPHTGYAVLFLDCNRFKLINDSLGHEAGDQLLLQLAHLLQTQVPDEAHVAHIGGDQFAVLISGDAIESITINSINHIQTALQQPFEIGARRIFITTAIGIAFSNADYHKPEHLLRDADAAMNQAKARKLPYCIFDISMHRQALALLEIETDLKQAIKAQEFVVYYQPIISLSTGRIVGLEALVRWHSLERGFVSPAAFIPAAEETGLIIPIGLQVLQQACDQVQHWITRYPALKTLKVNVNFSVKQFAQPDLLECIDRILTQTGLDGRHLKLEITESAIMDNAESAAEILDVLRSQHIQLAIDDFGTGYSSLSYLSRFPVDTLKIDRSFVNQLDTDDKSIGILHAVVTLAHTLNMDIVAEGIETPAQLTKLKTLGCEYAQGYLFSKPLDAHAIETLLNQPAPWSHFFNQPIAV